MATTIGTKGKEAGKKLVQLSTAQLIELRDGVNTRGRDRSKIINELTKRGV